MDSSGVNTPGFVFAPDPDNPGWMTWALSDTDRFNSTLGPMLVRQEGDLVRTRIIPGRLQSNLGNHVHGAATLTLIDIALFSTARVHGLIEAGTAVTLDLSTQFIGAGRLDEPLDAVTEITRETGRLLFLRGVVEQGEGGTHKVASFLATVRKPGKGNPVLAPTPTAAIGDRA